MFFIIFILNILGVKITKAGTIPVIGQEVILISSLNHPGRLILPKGKIKRGENPLDAAKRETLEESGAIGEIDPTVVFYNDSTVYYLMKVEEVQKVFEEEDIREVRKLKFEDVENSLRVVDPIKRIVRDVEKKLNPSPLAEFGFF